MAANVEKLLSEYSIEYVSTGSNVARGNVNIQCPWCGASDKSHHLGISLEKGYWGCWRSTAHRGRMFSALLHKLTGLPLAEARRLCGEGEAIAVQPGDYENALSSLTEGPTSAEEPKHSQSCAFDPYMHKLTGRTRSQKRAVQYLRIERGFPAEDIRRLARRYDIHFAIHGTYADRIVIPVYEQGVMQTYLGRSIYADSKLRYRALEQEESVKQVKDCIYNFDNAEKHGRTLYIVEGAIDVWKIDFYNYRQGHRAVGLFNMNLEESQIGLMYELRNYYKDFVILLDRGQVAESLVLEEKLHFLPGVRSKFITEAKDPGDLTPEQSIRLIEEA